MTRLLSALLLSLALVSPSFAAPTVVITKAPGVVRQNAAATLVAKTAPNTACTIAVVYKSVRSKAQGLGPKTANAGGVVSWNWKVGTKTTKGVWPVTVTCGGVSAKTTITVK